MEQEKIRLQKVFTDHQIMSRRAAEREIAAGNVRVNGRVAEIGQKVDPRRDKITLGGKPIRLAASTRHTYIMLNKPAGYVTTMADEKGRKCVTDLLEGLDERVYPVGRLDMYSDGLLLLTNDGALANALTHPRHHVPKIYHVRIEGGVTDEQIMLLSSPLEIDGYRIQPVRTELIDVEERGAVLKMTLYEGRNRQIRKMCELAGLKIRRLSRKAIGDINIGKLKVGEWKHLSRAQVDYLKNAVKE